MTKLLGISPGTRVLEIGTGSGYQTAILAELGAEIYTIEQDAGLAASAATLLEELGYQGIHSRHGNGFAGWPEAAPFARIIVTCAPEKLPPNLVRQLAHGGRMVLPMGDAQGQKLYLVQKDAEGRITQEPRIGVRFVPMLE